MPSRYQALARKSETSDEALVTIHSCGITIITLIAVNTIVVIICV